MAVSVTTMWSSRVQDRRPLTNIKWEHHPTRVHSHFHLLGFSKAYIYQTGWKMVKHAKTAGISQQKSSQDYFWLSTTSTGKPNVGSATLFCGRCHSHSVSFISSHVLRLRMAPAVVIDRDQRSSDVFELISNILHLQKLSEHVLAFKYGV